MKVRVSYNNGETKEITNYEIANGNNLRLGQESVTIKYTENGIEKTIEQEITVKERLNPEVENYIIVKENGINYIENITEETTIEELKNNINTNGVIEIYKDNNKITDENTVIGTGMEIKAKLNEHEETYIAIVRGDITGDGKIKMPDLLKLARYKAGVDKNLKGVYLRAGDIVKDGQIKMSDILKLARILAKIENN